MFQVEKADSTEEFDRDQVSLTIPEPTYQRSYLLGSLGEHALGGLNLQAGFNRGQRVRDDILHPKYVGFVSHVSRQVI